MKLGRAKPDAVNEPHRNYMFTILHARGYLGKKDICFSEVRLALLDLSVWPYAEIGNHSRYRLNSFHWNERGRVGILSVNQRAARIQLADLPQLHPAPAVG